MADLVNGSVSDPILDQVDFVNADDGWLVFGPAYPSAAGMDYVGMELWHTTNGGHTWTRVDQIPGRAIIAAGRRWVTFTSGTTGWMVEWEGGHPLILVHTTNAGRTWTPIPLAGTAPKSVPIFRGAVGVLLVENHLQTEVMEFTDAGQRLGPPRRIPVSKSGLSVFKVPEVNPRVLWDSTGNTLWRSENGGHTWTAQSHAALLTHDTAMDVLNRHVGWVWDATLGPSTMASTVNGGQTWTSWTPALTP